MEQVKIIPRVTRLTCKQCGHIWIPRTDHPTYCPRCFSRSWFSVIPLKPSELRFKKEDKKSPTLEALEELKRKLRGG